MEYVYTSTRQQDFVFYPVIIVQIDFLYYKVNGLWNNYKTIYMDSFSRNCDNCRKKIPPPPPNVKKNEFIVVIRKVTILAIKTQNIFNV
jgi:hypothetical protein